MYYRIYANPRHPVQTLSAVSTALPEWALSEGVAIAPPGDRSVYRCDRIDEPLDTGFGHFAVFYDNRKLIRSDFYQFLVSLGIQNIQVFDAVIEPRSALQQVPDYLNFNVVGVIDFAVLRSLFDPDQRLSQSEPNPSELILLDSDDGTGNVIVHDDARTRIESRFGKEVYFESLSG